MAYLLGNAVHDHVERTRWLLDHGADAGGVNFYSGEPVIKHAVTAGREEIADLLERQGAKRPVLSPEETFIAAAAAGNLAELRRLAGDNQALLATYPAMAIAIRGHRTDVAETLLDLGMSPDIGDEKNFRALHLTTHCGAVEIARLLIAHGAEIDPFEQNHGGSPLTHAIYQGCQDMVDLLAPLSDNLRGLCFAGAADRVRDLLAADPSRANRQDRPGETALFCLPADEDKAVAIAELLLSFGADPAFRNGAGHTPAETASRRGLDEAATLLEEKNPKH